MHVVKDLCKGKWSVFGQGCKALVTQRICRGRENNVKPDTFCLIGAQQAFREVGDGVAGPWPWTNHLETFFVDIHHNESGFGRVAGAPMDQLIFYSVLEGIEKLQCRGDPLQDACNGQHHQNEPGAQLGASR